MGPSLPLPRPALGRFPVPVQEALQLAPSAAARLWLLREDLSAPDYGGNKVRKLEHILAELEEGQPILTVGAVGSHHLAATALYAGRRGHPVHLLMGPQPDHPHARAQALLSHHLATHIEPLARWAELPAATLRAELRLRAAGQPPLLVPPGGSSVTGTMGAVDLGLELARRVAQGALPCPDRVYLPVGSGGSAAGLWVGLRAGGLASQVVGVRVAGRVLANMGRIRALALAAARRLPQPLPIPLSVAPPRLIHDQLGAGYGQPSAPGEAATRRAREAAGLELEPTYSAKALAGCLAELAAMPAGGNACFVVTANSRPLHALYGGAPRQLPPELDALLLRPRS